ncbi:uncharacterized protein LOC122278503 [Carya illinoinensis]|uniref:uncharacterized protein LOC122278503 n=1 Tax=Carya illinoinensis TaxID=32201 RepID=UPI001C7285AF|nr:uncharacterized protein LOC122278503 [Carya illinoinensis]
MEDIEDRWSNLRPTEEQEEVIEFPQGCEDEIHRKGERSLIGKICSDREVGKEVIASAMGKIWRISKRVVFQEVGKNVFVITFAYHADRQRILAGKPWLFANVLFLIMPYNGNLQPGKMHADKEAFWLQIHNLPLGFMTEDWGRRIGESVRNVLDVDADEDGVGWGKCLRVKVEMNLQKPIARGRTIMANRKKVWLNFKYEKLPKICLSCGWILHSESGCVKEGGGNQDSISQFGSWLRAEDSYRRCPAFISSNGNSNGREDGRQDPTKEAGRGETEGSIGSTASRRQTEDPSQKQNTKGVVGSENYGPRGRMAPADARQRNLVGNGGKLVAGVEDDGTRYGATKRVGENLHSVGSMQEDEVQAGRETLERTRALIVTGLMEEALDKPNRNNRPINQSHVRIYGEGKRPAHDSTVFNSQLILSDQAEGVISPNQGSRRWKRQARGQGSTSKEGGLRPGIKRPAETKEEIHTTPLKKRRGKNPSLRSNGIITSESVEARDQPHQMP